MLRRWVLAALLVGAAAGACGGGGGGGADDDPLALAGKPSDTCSQAIADGHNMEAAGRPAPFLPSIRACGSLLEWTEAAAYARLDDYDRARATLLEATRREPHDFVTWGLLGDLAVRRGDLGQARRAYARAADLNPRNLALQQLAKHPASAEK